MSLNPPAYNEILNQTLTSANTEYTIELPHGTTRFQIQTRQTADLKLCFTSGASGTTFWTLKGGMGYWETYIDPNGQEIKLYVQSPSAGTVVEVLCWKVQA